MTIPDPTQAVYLELALRALEQRDRPALAGALACLDPATLDHVAAVIAHPLWQQITARHPPLDPLPGIPA
jgi:hypothetical protein